MKTMKKLTLLAILVLAPFILNAYPIVFIHGWNSDRGTWDRMIDLLTTEDTDGNIPYTTRDMVFAVDYSKMTKLISHYAIDEIAGNVWYQIEGFKEGMESPKIDFVVHSMGGLVLRQLVASGRLPEGKIGRVVTLGTPHYGQRHNVPDKLLGGSLQTREMLFGSEFLWNLANSTKKISSDKVLCIGGTKDQVVDEWSAALDDKECRGTRYVNRCHSTFSMLPIVTDKDALYYCKLDWSDPVYKLVVEFLLHNRLFGGSINGEKNEGAILFQIMDGKGNPVAYESQIVSAVKDSSSRIVGCNVKSPITYKEEKPQGSLAMGIGAVYVKADPLPSTDGLPPGEYTFEIVQSKDQIFSAFTTEPIEVKRGRTTVIPIHAENVRPLDYVFLIDTTGSMGSHINSVKSNAKNLIETQLLNGARDCRVAVVDYRDFPERTGDSRDYAYDVKCGFTSDAATALSAINSLSLGYGGDGPETVYSGIHACIVGKGSKIGGWRENSVKTIMVMGDAQPLDPEPITGYTKSDVVRWANELKTAEDYEGVDIDWELKSTIKTAADADALASVSADESGMPGGISIYPVVTSSSLTSYFSEIAEETGGKVVSASSYASVADAVKEVIEQSVAANGFEFETVMVNETAGSVTVRVFGGSESDAASIGFQVVSGSAVSGADFTASSDEQRLSWAEGERSYKEIVIPIAEDSVSSLDKFFSIVLCNPVNMGLGGINVCRVNLTNVHSSETTSVGDVYLQGVSRQSEAGTVSGSGYYNIGETATLTASANEGWVFTSWENGDTSRVRVVNVAEAHSNAVAGVATYVASFVRFDDLPAPVITSENSLSLAFGADVYWAIDYCSISAAEVTCSGLPAGLELADGVVRGQATALGVHQVTFTVENEKGSVSKQINFIIQDNANFSDEELFVAEGKEMQVVVRGGSVDSASSVKVFLTYNTATAADIDLANGAVDGVTPKGGLKFPLTLTWAKGEIGEKVITIPVKTDKTVEDDEFFTLQLANAQGMELGEDRVCTVTIRDLNTKELKAAVSAYNPKKDEEVATNSVTVASGDAKGGFVAGTGEYTSGSKLTLTAEARPGWAFVGWRTGDGDGTILSDKAKWQVIVTNDAEYVAVFEKIPYIRGLADPADGGKVSGSGLCAAGKKVTLKATANKNFTFMGWREGTGNGFVATTASLVIDRTAKPVANSKTSTTITNIAEGVTYYAVFRSYPEVFVTVDATDDKGADPTGKGVGKYVAGTITGMGKYAIGKTKIALKATANKGYVFSGWYNADGVLITKDATYTIAAMGEDDVEYTAKFITAEEDKGSIALEVDGVEMEAAVSSKLPYQTNVWAGVYLEWPVAASAQSATTVKVAGLPSGLKFADKPVTSKIGTGTAAVVVTNVPANTIYGVPTAASKIDAKTGNVKPSEVKVTVTTAGKSSQTYQIDMVVDALPAWASGKFDGGSGAGQAQLTVAANGKLSGKYMEGGVTYSLAAGSYSSHADGTYYADVTASWSYKEGKATVKASDVWTLAVVEGAVGGVVESERFDAWQNLWSQKWWKDFGVQFFGKNGTALALSGEAYGLGEGESVVLSIKANGTVAAKGVFGKVSASGSAVVCPTSTEPFRGKVFVYFAPNPAKGFDGYVRVVDVGDDAIW